MAEITKIDTPARYRKMREQMESVLTPPGPIAFSTSGRYFEYEAPISMALPIGCYITMTTPDGATYLGLVTSQQVVGRDGPEFGIGLTSDAGLILARLNTTAQMTDRVQIRLLIGQGVLLGRLSGNQLSVVSERDTFQNATLAAASDENVLLYFENTREDKAAYLDVGTPTYGGVESVATMNASGFDRHTFLCGQSGSGKTFALGVVVEQLLLATTLRLVIIDPNSDFVRLGDIRKLSDLNRTRVRALSPTQYDYTVERYEKIATQMAILRPASCGTKNNKLQLWFSDLDSSEQAVLLGLDPLRDREEFNAFKSIVRRLDRSRYSLRDVLDSLAANFSSDARQVGLRIENLGIADWEIWSSGGNDSLVDVLDRKSRCTVLDVGSLESGEQRSAVATATLRYIWNHRVDRDPVMVVIDEAHNLCPGSPASELEHLVASQIVTLAGEGRKYGIYLLLATQRPEKVHANALSQCDNLVLMRMNSSSDLQHLAQLFSSVPVDLLSKATEFVQGQALVAGKLVRHPLLLRFGGRWSMEGGSDVPANWATKADA